MTFTFWFSSCMCAVPLWCVSTEGKTDKIENTDLLRLTERLSYLRTAAFSTGDWKVRGCLGLCLDYIRPEFTSRFPHWMVCFRFHYFLAFVAPVWCTLNTRKWGAAECFEWEAGRLMEDLGAEWAGEPEKPGPQQGAGWETKTLLQGRPAARGLYHWKREAHRAWCVWKYIYFQQDIQIQTASGGELKSVMLLL